MRGRVERSQGNALVFTRKVQLPGEVDVEQGQVFGEAIHGQKIIGLKIRRQALLKIAVATVPVETVVLKGSQGQAMGAAHHRPDLINQTFTLSQERAIVWTMRARGGQGPVLQPKTGYKICFDRENRATNAAIITTALTGERVRVFVLDPVKKEVTFLGQ